MSAAEEPPADVLPLPPDAFIAFRQSGGLRFSTLAVMVYLDGYVAWQRTRKFDAGQGERQLTPDEVADLQDLITQSGLFGLPRSIGLPSPDGYAYELIAQLADQSASIEFFTGSIPVEVQPIVQRLKQWTAEESG